MSMTYDNVKFSGDARDRIIEGVNCVVDAIQTTFGPNGKNVLIKTPSGVQSTKDGKTVAININLPDSYAQIGVELISEASQQMAKTVGDASSTVAILARQLINKFKNHPMPIQLFRDLEIHKEQLMEVIDKRAIPIKTKEDLVNCASISANNDRKIGQLVADAYELVGTDGIVTFEENDDCLDLLEHSKGFKLDSGYFNQGFVNNPKNTCELTNAYVYISDIKIENLREVTNLCDKALKDKRSLLLLAPEFDSEVIVFLKSNLSVLKSCCVIAPNFRIYRQIVLDDTRLILGIDSETKLAKCDKIICDAKSTTFIGYNSNTEVINQIVSDIKESIANNVYNEFDLKFHTKRLANFTSGIAIIKVGGYSDTERGNRMDLFEDSILATRQALLGGYIAGGGKGLKGCIAELDKTLINCSSSYFDFTDTLSSLAEILDIQYSEEELIERGVLEPVLITKEYINTAMSIANQILSCDCAIINTNLFFNND